MRNFDDQGEAPAKKRFKSATASLVALGLIFGSYGVYAMGSSITAFFSPDTPPPAPYEVYEADLSNLKKENSDLRLEIAQKQAKVRENSAEWNYKRCLIEIEKKNASTEENPIEYDQNIYDKCMLGK